MDTSSFEEDDIDDPIFVQALEQVERVITASSPNPTDGILDSRKDLFTMSKKRKVTSTFEEDDIDDPIFVQALEQVERVITASCPNPSDEMLDDNNDLLYLNTLIQFEREESS